MTKKLAGELGGNEPGCLKVERRSQQTAANVPQRQPIKAVIFDMDGVLLDTESMCDKTWVTAAEEAGMSIAAAERALSECRGCNRGDTISILQNLFGASFQAEEYISRTNELFREMEERDGIPVMEGTDDALRYIKERGYIIALASSTKGETVRRQLQNAGLIGYFATITTGDTVMHSKPHGEIYCKAAASLGLSPAECAAIEDSPNGVISATAAGMKCIMVPDRENPTDEIRSLAWQVLPSLKDIKSVL